MLPFWLSIAVLSGTQGAIVALSGRVVSVPLSSRWWAAVPPASVLGFVLIAQVAQSESTSALTYIALVGVPIGAALALGWLLRGARPALSLLVLPMFALAWADQTGLAGQAAAVALSACSAVALGLLLAAVTPPRWLAAGILAMALVDSTLVAIELLQTPNNALNAAHPAAGLPKLQVAVFGSAVMGYGDLFVAGVFCGLLAATVGVGSQRRAGVLVAALALVFDLLFFAFNELPATVPVALALLTLTGVSRLRSNDRGAASRLGGSNVARAGEGVGRREPANRK